MEKLAVLVSGSGTNLQAILDAAVAVAFRDAEKEMLASTRTETTGVVWICLSLYVLVGLCGVGNIVLPQVVEDLRSQ